MRTFCFLATAMALLAAIAGCAEPVDPNLVPVSGVVKYKGKPLDHADLQFMPIEDTRGRGAKARSDSSGHFKLKYNGGGEGALPGQYKVLVCRNLLPDGSPEPPEVEPGQKLDGPPKKGKNTLPIAFMLAADSKLVVAVPGKGGTVDVELK